MRLAFDGLGQGRDEACGSGIPDAALGLEGGRQAADGADKPVGDDVVVLDHEGLECPVL